MANKKFLLGILALALVFGMTVVGCDSGSSDDGGGGGGGGSGTFTLTGIPAEYNGKYAYFMGGGNESVAIIGAKSVTRSGATAVQIANGSVSLPTWTFNISANGINNIKRYTGNDTGPGSVNILNTATITDEDDLLAERMFLSIAFSRGSASKSWNDGIDIEDED